MNVTNGVPDVVRRSFEGEESYKQSNGDLDKDFKDPYMGCAGEKKKYEETQEQCCKSSPSMQIKNLYENSTIKY